MRQLKLNRLAKSVREARGVERRLRGESSRLEELTPEEERMLAKFLRELAMKVWVGDTRRGSRITVVCCLIWVV